jgi:type IV pilus assembly protein PilE
MTRKMQAGVTLMELLATLAVVGILGAIAVPTYRNYMIRANRSEAKELLLQLQTAEEKFYLDNNAYTANVTDAPPGGLGLSGTSHTGKYALGNADVAVAANGQTYTATVSPVAGKGQDDDAHCTTFTLTDTGVRGSSGTASVAECWK